MFFFYVFLKINYTSPFSFSLLSLYHAGPDPSPVSSSCMETLLPWQPSPLPRASGQHGRMSLCQR